MPKLRVTRLRDGMSWALQAAKGASDEEGVGLTLRKGWEECCSPTCRLHSCGLGYVGNTSYDNNTGASTRLAST